MRCLSCGKSDIGRVRKTNQDAFLCDDELGLYVVADGMGGHAAGEIAAREAVQAIHDMIVRGREVVQDFLRAPATRESTRAICRLLESSVQSATYLVFGMAEQEPVRQGMGTTVSALLLAGAYGITAQVGDTRIYCVRGDDVIQLTEDHTLVNWQIREGMLTPDEAARSPHRNVITRAVGNHDYVQVDTQVISVRIGDRFLICSDGLHGYVKRGEIGAILAGELPAACDTLVSLANQRGGRDNITAVTIEVCGQGA
jgi:serine/threonine protein phosphatase PrpC